MLSLRMMFQIMNLFVLNISVIEIAVVTLLYRRAVYVVTVLAMF